MTTYITHILSKIHTLVKTAASVFFSILESNALTSSPLDARTSSRGLAAPKGLANGSPLALVLLRRPRSLSRPERGFSCVFQNRIHSTAGKKELQFNNCLWHQVYRFYMYAVPKRKTNNRLTTKRVTSRLFVLCSWSVYAVGTSKFFQTHLKLLPLRQFTDIILQTRNTVSFDGCHGPKVDLDRQFRFCYSITSTSLVD